MMPLTRGSEESRERAEEISVAMRLVKALFWDDRWRVRIIIGVGVGEEEGWWERRVSL